MYLGRIVEEGPALEVVGNPQHPYTQALISVVPKPDPRDRSTPQILTRRDAEPGPRPVRVPLPSALPAGVRTLRRRRSGRASPERRPRPHRRLLAPCTFLELAAELTPARQRWTLAACCCSQFMILLDVTIAERRAAVDPARARRLDGQPRWVVNAYVLVARVADPRRRDARRPLRAHARLPRRLRALHDLLRSAARSPRATTR